MSFSFSDFSSALEAGGAISPGDVLAIRRAVWPDGIVARSEADRLFELHRRVRSPGPEWSDFFIEAIADTVLNATEPKAYVDDDSTEWLIGQLGRGGRPVGGVEVELVVGSSRRRSTLRPRSRTGPSPRSSVPSSQAKALPAGTATSERASSTRPK